MPSANEFELLELLHQDVAETWLAVEKASGRRLLLHKFSKKSGLRDRLLSMSPEDLILLVNAMDQGNGYIVVTHDVPAVRRFREWVESRSVATPGLASETPSAPAVQAAPAAPFDPTQTQPMPRAAVEARIRGELEQMTPAVVDSSPVPPVQAGEFTQAFKAPLRNEPVSPAKSAPALPNELAASAGASAPAGLSAPTGTSGLGDFTRRFSAPAVRNEPSPPVASAPRSPNEPSTPAKGTPAPAAEPGEFTQMFSSPAVRDEPNLPVASAPLPKKEPTGAAALADTQTPLRNKPSPPPANTPALPSEPSSAAKSTPAPAAEPGEFTQMFSSPAVRNEPNLPAASAPLLKKEPAASAPDLADTQTPLRNEASRPPVSRPALRNEPTAASAPVVDSGEFTRMFAPPPVRNEPNVPAASALVNKESASAPDLADTQTPLRNEASRPPVSRPSSRNEPTAASAPVVDSGEFTRMFAPPPVRNEAISAGKSAPSPAEPVPLRNEPKRPPPDSQTSDFTRMFSTPSAQPPLPKPASTAPSGTGEFTKFFNNPLPTTPLGEKLHTAKPEIAAQPARHALSEFTRTFGSLTEQANSPANVVPRQEPAAHSGGGDATGLFAGPKVPSTGSMQPSAPSGPGEYTRIFQQPTAGIGAAEVPAPVAKAPLQPELKALAPAAKKVWPLVIVLAVLAIAAILLLVYFLVKR